MNHRSEAVTEATLRCAAELLSGNPVTAPLAERIETLLETGPPTRSRFGMLVEPGSRGGDHGRGDAVKRRPEMLRRLSRDYFQRKSKRESAEAMRKEFCAVLRDVEVSVDIGRVRDDLYWQIERLIRSRAIVSGSGIIDLNTIEREL